MRSIASCWLNEYTVVVVCIHTHSIYLFVTAQTREQVEGFFFSSPCIDGFACAVFPPNPASYEESHSSSMFYMLAWSSEKFCVCQ